MVDTSCCIFISRNTDCLGMVVSTSYSGDAYFFNAKHPGERT